MKQVVEIISRCNNESCSLRLIVYGDGGCVSDIIEGPMKFVIERLMINVSPETKLRLRKVRK